jgi:hypothetical protein
MIDKERAIQTVMEDMGARERLSSIRKGLGSAGFSPEEIHEIISEAIERRKASRQEPKLSGVGLEMIIIGLGVITLVITCCAAPPRIYYGIPNVLLAYGFYLWYIKPGSE